MSQARTAKHYHHGRTPAAWVSTWIATIAFAIAAFASVMGPNWTLVWLSVFLLVLSPIVGLAMRKMGFGQA